MTFTTCPECDGTRLEPGSAGRRRSRARTSPTSARCRSTTWPTGSGASTSPSVAPLLTGLQHLLDSFAEIGLGYLSLDRPSGTLSGGEAQRTQDDPPASARRSPTSRTSSTSPRSDCIPMIIERMNDLLLRAARTRATPCSSSSTSPSRSRSPTTSSTSAGRRHGRRHRLLRGHGGGAAGERAPRRSPSERPGGPQGIGAFVLRHAGDPRRVDVQPPGRGRRPPARGALRGHRRRTGPARAR